MTDMGPVIVSILAGLGLGMLFFGGLWWTVRALPRSERPALLALGSFWTRTAIMITGFVFVTNRRWQNAVGCLVGFVLARLLLGWLLPNGHASGGTTG